MRLACLQQDHGAARVNCVEALAEPRRTPRGLRKRLSSLSPASSLRTPPHRDPPAPVHHSGRDQAGIPGGRLCCLERLLDTEPRPTGKPRPIGGPAPGRCRLVAVATPWAPISLALALPGNAAAIATAGRVQPSIGAGDALRQSGLQSPEPDPEEGPNHGPSRAGAVSRWVPGPTPERL